MAFTLISGVHLCCWKSTYFPRGFFGLRARQSVRNMAHLSRDRKQPTCRKAKLLGHKLSQVFDLQKKIIIKHTYSFIDTYTSTSISIEKLQMEHQIFMYLYILEYKWKPMNQQGASTAIENRFYTQFFCMHLPSRR